MYKILDKRQVNSIFKATVKIIKDTEVKTIEDIENVVELNYCHGEENYISYYLGEYNGTINKKELVKNDAYFKSSNITKQLAYLDISIEDDKIKIQTIAFIEYTIPNWKDSQFLVLHETII